MENVTITGPQEQVYEVPVEGGQLLFDQTSIAGFYELQIGRDSEIWSVNLTDEAESRIGTAEGLADSLDDEVMLSGSALLCYPPWIYLVSLAIALSVGAWFLYQRRRVD